jgi:hypothetical protein
MLRPLKDEVPPQVREADQVVRPMIAAACFMSEKRAAKGGRTFPFIQAEHSILFVQEDMGMKSRRQTSHPLSSMEVAVPPAPKFTTFGGRMRFDHKAFGPDQDLDLLDSVLLRQS